MTARCRSKPPISTSVVLIGPTAGQVDAIGINGERSMGLTGAPGRSAGGDEAISGNANIRFAVDDDMTGTPIPATALSHDGKPGLAYAGPDGAHTDAALEFHASRAATRSPPDLTAEWTGTLTVATRGQLLALSPGAGHRRQPLHRRQARGRHRHIPGRRAWRHPASQPGQCDPHHRRAGQCAPRRRSRRRAACHRDQDQPRHFARAGAGPARTGTRPNSAQADHDAAIDAARHAKIAVVFVWARRTPVFVIPGEQTRW